jgi:hypothetical protein
MTVVEIMTRRFRRSKRVSGSSAAPRMSSTFAILWMFTAIVVGLLALANFSFGLLSSVRAYVGGESLWSKGQKDAVFHVQRYAASGDPEEFRKFREAIDVPLGDRAARIEMDKPDPDFEKVRRGFIRGHIRPDEIDGMFRLYRGFAWISFIQRAIRAWEAGDRYIVRLDAAGTLLQREIESPTPSADRVQSVLTGIFVVIPATRTSPGPSLSWHIV